MEPMAPADAAADAIGGVDGAVPVVDAPPESGIHFDVDMLSNLIDLGGPVFIVLALLSVIGLAIAIVKLLQFRRARVWRSRAVVEAVDLYRAGQRQAAESRLRAIEGPLARAVAVAIAARDDGDRELARETTETVALAEIEALRGGLRPLEFIAGVSPLLGLFGTVLGMIAAFQALQAAGDRVDPAVLAGGIWEALFTTDAGLAVAIPALALSNWFDRTVDALAGRIEHLAGLVLTAPAAAIKAAADGRAPAAFAAE